MTRCHTSQLLWLNIHTTSCCFSHRKENNMRNVLLWMISLFKCLIQSEHLSSQLVKELKSTWSYHVPIFPMVKVTLVSLICGINVWPGDKVWAGLGALPKRGAGVYVNSCSLQDRIPIVIFITADHIALSCGDSTALRTWRTYTLDQPLT